MPRVSKSEKSEALARLREHVKDGDTVFLVLRKRAPSGMSRTIAPFVFRNGEPRFLGFNVALVLGLTFNRKEEGVLVRGCGMDMGFALVDDMAHALGLKLTHHWL